VSKFSLWIKSHLVFSVVLAVFILVSAFIAIFRHEVVPKFECMIFQKGNSDGYVDFILTKYSSYKKESLANLEYPKDRLDRMRKSVAGGDLDKFDKAASTFRALISQPNAYLYRFSAKSHRLQTNYYIVYDDDGKVIESYHGATGLASKVSCISGDNE